jgi:hypothetical protein
MSARSSSLLVLCILQVFLFGQRLPGVDARWEFNGDLESSTGNAALEPRFAAPASEASVTFETAQIGGQDADVARFTQGTYLNVFHGMAPNGGGAYVNQYTLIMDVMFPDRGGGTTSLFQTNCCNENEGDWFIGPTGGLGSLGMFSGSVPDGAWHRLALVVDLTVGTMTSFVDGVQVHQDAGQDLDGRFALYSPTDGDPEDFETFFIFADNASNNAEGLINSLQFHDLALAAGVIAEIGGPSASGIPSNICIFPPAVATRDIATFRTARETNADYLPGDLMDVKIVVSEIRAAVAPCTAPAGVVIVETLPAGWTPSQISDSGAHSAGPNTITWTLTGPAFVTGKELSYKVTAAASNALALNFNGTVTENTPGAKASPVRGESRLLTDNPYDDCGGIRCWNILGCFGQPANNWPDAIPGSGDNPGVDHMRLDFLSDSEIFESDFIWYPGAQIATAFGGDGLGAAVSTDVQSGTNGANPNGVPEVLAWNDRDSFINLDSDVYGADHNTVMVYMQCYVVNPGADREVQIGVDSDDSVQVILNDEEVWIHSVGRGAGACQFRDKSPDGVTFPGPITVLSGQNKLIVKVFEGGGDFNSQFRFEDPETLDPITDFAVSKFPQGLCITPPLIATRDVATLESVLIQRTLHPRWKDGQTYDVSISLSDIRAAGGLCAAPTNVRIEETVPEGWIPSVPSSGGSITGTKITWNLTGAQIAAGVLTYKVEAHGESGPVTFRGKVSEVASPVASAVIGETTLQNPSALTDRCFIKTWLLLGPYAQPGAFGANPGVGQIQRDHLCDGVSIDELSVEPKAGDTVNTSYGDCARSTGLSPGATTPINPGGVPTWAAWLDTDDTINFGDYYGANLDRTMMYAVAYVDVAADIVVDIGLDSDDSVQVLLDGNEVWVNNVARGMGASNAVADVISASGTPALNPLTAGRHKLMVKVFEGTDDHGFRLRFQDPATTEGVCDGISVCINPVAGSCVSTVEEICTGGVDEDGDGDTDCADSDCASAPTCLGTRLIRGDSDANGAVNITDAVRILNVLFLGIGVITCDDAADADDNGAVNITDAVRILNVLFLGLGIIPPPNECGVDPTEDALTPGCASHPPCA